jgi:GxxExxY protein
MPQKHYPKLTDIIVDSYHRVYNELGTYYPEVIYQRALQLALRTNGLDTKREVTFDIFYEEQLVGKHILDMIVADKIVLELKVAGELTKLHKAQIISYLKATGYRLGFLMNFGSTQPEFQPVPNKIPYSLPSKSAERKNDRSDLPFAKLRYECIGAGFSVYNALGTGYRYRIYSNAYYFELQKRNIPFQHFKKIGIYFQNYRIGESTYHHFLIDDKFIVFTTTIDHFDQIDKNSLRKCMRQHDVSHAIVLNFQGISLGKYFLKLKKSVLRAGVCYRLKKRKK